MVSEVEPLPTPDSLSGVVLTKHKDKCLKGLLLESSNIF